MTQKIVLSHPRVSNSHPHSRCNLYLHAIAQARVLWKSASSITNQQAMRAGISCADMPTSALNARRGHTLHRRVEAGQLAIGPAPLPQEDLQPNGGIMLMGQ